MSTARRAAIAALVTIVQPLWAQPLWADVTPDDVWLEWQTMAQAQGARLTADSTDTQGDTLILSAVTLTLTNKATAQIAEIRLMDTGDGSVAVDLPDSFPILLTSDGKVLNLNVTAPDAEITASGVPLSISYAKHLPRLEMTAKDPDSKTDLTLKATEVTGTYLAEAGESGKNLTGAYAVQSLTLMATGNDDTDVNLSLTGLDGKLNLTGLPAEEGVELQAALDAGMTFDAALSYGIGSLDVSGVEAGQPFKLAGTLGGGNLALALDAAKFHYDVNTKAISLNLSGSDTATGPFTFVGAMADLGTYLDINGRGWSNSDDFDAALKSGLVMAGGGNLGSTNIDFAGSADQGPVKVKASLASAKTEFTLAASQLTYDLGAKAVSVSVAAPEIPVPEVTVDLTELAVGLLMPVAKSDKPAPFSYLTRIIDLNLPPAVWALLDPASTLPHTPATLIIDTRGTATVTADLMQGEAPDGMSPGFLNSLDLPQILIRALGAEVTAKGGFTFDPTDTETFDMPLPTGKVDIRGTGLNGLIDKLVTMGVLPSDTAMQARMGISMFARNDMAKDEVTTTLEFRDKHFFANGAQMQ